VAYTAELQNCTGTVRRSSGGALLAVNPFYAPRYHFGMLMGVDDFEAEQAYHRGKNRLHNVWLHGEGVVWGLMVDAPEIEGDEGELVGEIRVRPGLALDAAGRELFLPQAACVGVAAWYSEHEDDPELQAVVEVGENGTVTFDAHVVARFRACLSRPVPAISEPCVGAGTDTAYSRAQETVELLLVPGPSPVRSERYHRLRVLFAIADARLDDDGIVLPEDQEVLDARAEVLALPSEDRPSAYLDAFRRFAAFDEMDLEPAVNEQGHHSHFPENDDTVVVLAELRGITLVPDGEPEQEDEEESYTLEAAEVDNTVRPVHVATSTIQELLCGPLFGLLGGPLPEEEEEETEDAEEDDGGEEVEPPPPDGGKVDLPVAPVTEEGAAGEAGPRILPDSVELEGEAVSMRASAPLSRASVAREAFVISAYDSRDGWREVEIARDPILDRTRRRIRIELSSGFGGNLIRIIARGTGPAPILGTDLLPLSGAVGGPNGGPHDGHDFVFMMKRSET
jgi:hypothetical protein